MGYTNVGHYAGGMEEWTASGERVESGGGGGAPIERAAPRRPSRRLRPLSLIERLADLSYGALLGFWLVMVFGLGVVYWLWSVAGFAGLREAGAPIARDLSGLATALYFSIVTATSVGFGDVVPVGLTRLLATLEGAAGLLVFGCLVSKLVSRRQEELAEATHRIAFDERLGRLRTNLHLVLSELQTIAGDCHDAAVTPDRTLARLESAALVFAGELRTVHDLLYRPQEVPQEMVFEGLLANLAANLGEMRSLLQLVPDAPQRSQLLTATLASIQMQANEICGRCVPREYALELRVWMDRIQDTARMLTPRANSGNA